MYGKLFTSMYDGSLADNWQALVTFQQLIILCDPDGIVDMTPLAISRRTGIPQEIIDQGLEALSQPDFKSRSDLENGKRIILVDPERDWGWQIVNHSYYKKLASQYEKREADRIRIAEKRKKAKENNGVASSRVESQRVVNVAHTDTDTDTDKEKKTNKRKERKKKSKKIAYSNDFESFWHLYPKKEGKGYAFECWKKIKEPIPALDQILLSIAKYKNTEQWEDHRYIPQPSKFINQRMWEDEPQEGGKYL